MITEITTSNLTQAKTLSMQDNEVISSPSQPFKSFSSKRIDINNAKDFDNYLNNLKNNQTIAYGLFGNPSGPRSLKNVEGIDNPWIAFDGDYLINNSNYQLTTEQMLLPPSETTFNQLTLEHLVKLDPQLATARYVMRHSSSNIIIKGNPPTPVNDHKKKIWFQFKTTDQAEIKQYIDRLFKRAILLNYGQYFMSASPKSYHCFLRTIFDAVVFSPERIWNETHPIIDSDNLTHNTYSEYGEGVMVVPAALPKVSDAEESLYHQFTSALKQEMQSQITAKRHLVEESYPVEYARAQAASKGIITSSLITSDGRLLRVVDIIDAHLSAEQAVERGDAASIYDHTHPLHHTTLSKQAFKDPLDPAYGDDKAKLFFNKGTERQRQSIILNSFAHGESSYRLLVKASDFYDLKLVSQLPQSDGRLTEAEKKRGQQILRKVITFLYVDDDENTSEILLDGLKRFGGKPELRKLFAKAVNYKASMLERSDMMNQYSLYKRGAVPWVSFDKEEGLTFITKDGLGTIMDNRLPNITGAEITQAYQMSDSRKEVDGFGLFINAPANKLNLWSGFNAFSLGYRVTEAEIAPYLELARLIAQTPEEMAVFLDWRADLVQNPLRKGGRPGYAVKGDKGTGKSFEQDLIADFFHPFNVQRVNSIDQIVGKHNAELSYTVLIIAEEMNMGHTSYAGAKDAMKSLLFSPTVRVEPKGVDSVNVPNHLHLMLSTNHAAAVIQDSDDRRWTIFEINPAKRRDKRFFATLSKWWKHGGKNKVFTYLSQRNYTLTEAMEGKLTRVGKLERINGFFGVDAWVYHLLCTRTARLSETIAVLYEEYSDWFMLAYHQNQVPTVKKFAMELHKQAIFITTGQTFTLNLEAGKKLFEEKFFERQIHDWKV